MMTARSLVPLFAAVVALTCTAGIDLAPIDASPDRNPSTLDVGLRRIGTIRPRPVSEIRSSNWTLDCGTIDRGYVRFSEFRDYIAPLGIGRIRLQTGWARCERERGRFDFAWLDECVDWAVAQGIGVILDMSYGNPIYSGAGGSGLKDGIPNTEAGLREWDRWTETVARRYGDRVKDYAMWNEPDINPKENGVDEVVAFNVRTAKTVRRLVPGCCVHGLTLASNDPEIWERYLKALGGDARLFDVFVYHAYTENPDFIYENVERLKALCAKYAPHAAMRQGEAGCPSDWCDLFAFHHLPWTETSQAKWDMRRMLGDLGHDVESSILHICDMAYDSDRFRCINRKGLLRTNAAHQVFQVKKAYYAVQNVASVFDGSLTRVKAPRISTSDRRVSVYEYKTHGGRPLFVFWSHGRMDIASVRSDGLDGKVREEARMSPTAAPTDSFETFEVAFDLTDVALEDPVWTDLFTGAAYAFPSGRQIRHSCGTTLMRVPVYDSPCVLTERGVLDLVR